MYMFSKMTLAGILKSRRTDLGLTQIELAFACGISLPTVQNIELGKANPSHEIVVRLLSRLGLFSQVRVVPCDWEKLSALGVPLFEVTGRAKLKSGFKPNKEDLVLLVFAGLSELQLENFSGRKADALQSLLLAIKSHYPKFFRTHFVKSKLVQQCLAKNLSGRIIKLKRLALAKLGEFL